MKDDFPINLQGNLDMTWDQYVVTREEIRRKNGTQDIIPQNPSLAKYVLKQEHCLKKSEKIWWPKSTKSQESVTPCINQMTATLIQIIGCFRIYYIKNKLAQRTRKQRMIYKFYYCHCAEELYILRKACLWSWPLAGTWELDLKRIFFHHSENW